VRTFKTEALVLNRTDFSNTSQIVDLFTCDHGRIPVIAKGVRQYRKRVHRLIDLLYRGNAIILEKSSREVQILSDFETLDHYPGLRRHLDRYHAGLHLLHCLRRATQPGGEDRRLFSLSVRALARIHSVPLDRLPAEILAFDFRFLAVIGYQQSLDSCPLCGTRHGPDEETRFTPTAGGCLCRRCGPRSPGTSLPFSGQGRRLLIHLARLTGSDRDRVPLPLTDLREVRKILNIALTSLLEAKLPMLKYLLPS